MPAPSDLLDIFGAYDAGVIFRGLAGADGSAGVLGSIGWIFTGMGACFVLWGFVLRSREAQGKLGEIAKTWIVIGFMVAGPLLMRSAMQAADSVMDSTLGGPRNLTVICVKAAYAMPELSVLFDSLKNPPPPAGGGTNAQLLNSANDGSVLGYLEAFGIGLWDTAQSASSAVAGTWKQAVRLLALLSGFGSAMLKCLLIIGTILPVYFMLLCSSVIVWFMEQLRFFLAVVGTMMLPLFIGMFSLPSGHPNRQAATNYVMQMVSLALWPLAWTIGHTGTVALYNALISLIAGTSRVPEINQFLQWTSLDSGALTQDQLRTMEAALGNWFMGNAASLLAILVGGIGFFLWIVMVSVLGPVFLHRMLSTGSHFMAEALQAAGRQGAAGGRLAIAGAPSALSTLAAPAMASSVLQTGALVGSVAQPAVISGGLGTGSASGATRTSLAQVARDFGKKLS